MMIRRSIALAFAIGLTLPALAAPPTNSGGATGAGYAATGKVSVQDLHFASRATAEAQCGKSVITAAADGSFTCPAPTSSSMAISEQGMPAKPKPTKPQ